MAKKSKQAEGAKELTIKYDLFALPSAQHKAGLAGLLVLIESLRRRNAKHLPDIVEGPTSSGVTLRFTPQSMQLIYDDFFQPVTIDLTEKNGKSKRKDFPRGTFLETFSIPVPWLAIWRDVIRNVIRAGAPAQFQPYRDRSTSVKRPKTWDWQKTWTELEKNRQTSLSASDYLGAESTTADGVPFKNRSKDAFLLTFASVVSLPFISQTLKRRSKAGEAVYRFQRNAYVVATPEVSHLKDFVNEYPNHVATLDPKTIGNDRYPVRARVSVPAEGGLEFLTSHHILTEQASKFPIAEAVSGVLITHLKYGKGSPHLQHIGMLPKNTSVLDDYIVIREHTWNYLYRELRIRNLLENKPWYTAVDQLFADHPVEIFVHRSGTPHLYFETDVQRTFDGIRQILRELEHMKGNPEMADEWRDKDLADRIFWVTQTYVNRRTADKCDGMTWDDYKSGKGNIQKYRESREKVCLDAFLALRGRDDADLVSYFVGTFCSVPQNLNQERFLNIGEQLLTEDGKVKIKTLAMLALSAHSYLWDGKTKNSNDEKGK